MKLTKFLNKQGAYYIFGLFLLAIGISLIVKSNAGAAPWDWFCVQMNIRTDISIGTWQIIFNLSMIVLSKILFKKWYFICLIPGFIQGLFIDATSYMLAPFTIHPLVAVLLGCLLSGIGLAIYINQGLTSNAIDNFTYCLHKEYKLSLGVSKVIADLIPIIGILCIGSYIPLGTVFVYLAVPVCINVSQMVYRLLVTKVHVKTVV